MVITKSTKCEIVPLGNMPVTSTVLNCVVIFFFLGFLATISQATCHSTLQHFMNDLKKGPIGLMCYFAGAPAAGKSSTYDPAVRRPLAAITKEFQKPISSMVCIIIIMPEVGFSNDFSFFRQFFVKCQKFDLGQKFKIPLPNISRK